MRRVQQRVVQLQVPVRDVVPVAERDRADELPEEEARAGLRAGVPRISAAAKSTLRRVRPVHTADGAHRSMIISVTGCCRIVAVFKDKYRSGTGCRIARWYTRSIASVSAHHLGEEEAMALGVLVLVGDVAGQVAAQGDVHQHRQVLVSQAHLSGAVRAPGHGSGSGSQKRPWPLRYQREDAAQRGSTGIGPCCDALVTVSGIAGITDWAGFTWCSVMMFAHPSPSSALDCSNDSRTRGRRLGCVTRTSGSAAHHAESQLMPGSHWMLMPCTSWCATSGSTGRLNSFTAHC